MDAIAAAVTFVDVHGHGQLTTAWRGYLVAVVAVLVCVPVIAWQILRWIRELGEDSPGDEGRGGGGGEGGRGPPPPEPPPSEDDFDWWPAFERQFAAYVAAAPEHVMRT